MRPLVSRVREPVTYKLYLLHGIVRAVLWIESATVIPRETRSSLIFSSFFFLLFLFRVVEQTPVQDVRRVVKNSPPSLDAYYKTRAQFYWIIILSKQRDGVEILRREPSAAVPARARARAC